MSKGKFTKEKKTKRKNVQAEIEKKEEKRRGKMPKRRIIEHQRGNRKRMRKKQRKNIQKERLIESTNGNRKKRRKKQRENVEKGRK